MAWFEFLAHGLKGYLYNQQNKQTMKTFRFIAAVIFISIAGTALAGNGYGNRYGDYGRHEIRERRMDWRGYERPCVACVHPGYYSSAPVLYPAPVVVFGAY